MSYRLGTNLSDVNPEYLVVTCSSSWVLAYHGVWFSYLCNLINWNNCKWIKLNDASWNMCRTTRVDGAMRRYWFIKTWSHRYVWSMHNNYIYTQLWEQNIRNGIHKGIHSLGYHHNKGKGNLWEDGSWDYLSWHIHSRWLIAVFLDKDLNIRSSYHLSYYTPSIRDGVHSTGRLI